MLRKSSLEPLATMLCEETNCYYCSLRVDPMYCLIIDFVNSSVLSTCDCPSRHGNMQKFEIVYGKKWCSCGWRAKNWSQWLDILHKSDSFEHLQTWDLIKNKKISILFSTYRWLVLCFPSNALILINQLVARSAQLKRTPYCAQSLGQIVARSQ